MYPSSETNCLVGYVEADISYVIFVFCTSRVAQNVKITWHIPVCLLSTRVFPMLFSHFGLPQWCKCGAKYENDIGNSYHAYLRCRLAGPSDAIIL